MEEYRKDFSDFAPNDNKSPTPPLKLQGIAIYIHQKLFDGTKKGNKDTVKNNNNHGQSG